MESTTQRIALMRAWMDRHNVDAVIIPSTDPHQSEYPPEHHRVRVWISGFTGSAGTVVITRDNAGLWTDSRYFLEAEAVLANTEIKLHRLHTSGVLDYPDWLFETVQPGATIAVDFRAISIATYHSFASRANDAEVSLLDLGDSIDEMWRERPDLPAEPITPLATSITGQDVSDKLTEIRRVMVSQGCTYHIISTLDDIAWVLNLRGRDVPYNPVFLAYLLIDEESATLYTDPRRLDDEVKKYLHHHQIATAPYDRFFDDLPTLNGAVLLDPQRTSKAVAERCTSSIVEGIQPSTPAKARKNETELSNLRKAMRADGAAMVRFLRWFDMAIADDAHLDEISAAAELQKQRRSIPEYVSDSFTYISGFNGNGAIVHYSVDEQSNAVIAAPGVYLIDSGGQYTNGTTDITRTIPVGTAPDEARRDFTLVLKGVIALSRIHFPEGTTGHEIDAIARVALWRDGKNYGHGTGHGVGFFLNVHEGPQRIAPTVSDWPLEAGMIVSNEPGMYRTGQWGIRIENLLAVSAERETEFGRFLSFETLTLCPIDRRMVEASLLNREEREWLDTYHRRVREELAPLLNEDEVNWLNAATAAL